MPGESRDGQEPFPLDELIAHASKRIVFISEIPRKAVEAFVANSLKSGFMRTAPDLSRLFETP